MTNVVDIHGDGGQRNAGPVEREKLACLFEAIGNATNATLREMPDFSDETIRRRYSRSVRNFLELYRPVVTTWQVYDNSNGGSRLIAFNNAHFDTVLDPDVWAAFNRSASDGGQTGSGGD